jgi:hypothetical protein
VPDFRGVDTGEVARVLLVDRPTQEVSTWETTTKGSPQ